MNRRIKGVTTAGSIGAQSLHSEHCEHILEIPISEGGDILFWRCQCGLRREKAKNSKNEEPQRK